MSKDLPTLSPSPEKFPETLVSPRCFTGIAHIATVPAGCCGTVAHSPGAGAGTRPDRRYIHTALPCSVDLHARSWKLAVPGSALFYSLLVLSFLHIPFQVSLKELETTPCFSGVL